MVSATRDRQHAPGKVTPLVEVLLALLVLGWATLAFGGWRQSGEAQPVAAELRLQVGPAGTYALAGQTIEQADLEAALQRAHARSPDLRLRIAAADGSDYDALVHALAAARDAGIRNVGSEML